MWVEDGSSGLILNVLGFEGVSHNLKFISIYLLIYKGYSVKGGNQNVVVLEE